MRSPVRLRNREEGIRHYHCLILKQMSVQFCRKCSVSLVTLLANEFKSILNFTLCQRSSSFVSLSCGCQFVFVLHWALSAYAVSLLSFCQTLSAYAVCFCQPMLSVCCLCSVSDFGWDFAVSLLCCVGLCQLMLSVCWLCSVSDFVSHFAVSLLFCCVGLVVLSLSICMQYSLKNAGPWVGILLNRNRQSNGSRKATTAKAKYSSSNWWTDWRNKYLESTVK